MIDAALWRENVIKAVKDIASREFQQRTWFGKDEEVSSPDEIYNTLFDDVLFGDFLQSSDIGLTKSQREYGFALIDTLEEYSPDESQLPSPEVMIDDPKWQVARNAANTFLESLENKDNP